MPVRFARLRLVGFKSFAEPAEIEILPGLTGIVGPNGCGKSNIVDAFRFIMGEGSAHAMRGSETEDLIFGGTAARPARNLAEVTLTLEAEAHDLPAPLESGGTIAFSRHVERGRGSTFRINGREARARDVQALFADLGSGARSSALIGQGRIAELLATRPDARRAILDEAAGIVGLHGRRHEAELKLAATEANLVRVGELRAELAQQLTVLKRQLRQANRYRTLKQAIRATEAELLAIEKAHAEAVVATHRSALDAARSRAAEANVAAERAGRAATEAEAALPALRAAEETHRAKCERARAARERLVAESERVQTALVAVTSRLAELDRDLAHGETLRQDGEAASARLDAEHTTLVRALEGYPERIAAAEAAFSAARSAREAADVAAERAAGTNAACTAETNALDREEERTRQRRKRLLDERLRLQAERAKLDEGLPLPDSLLAAEAAEARAAADFARAIEERDRLEATRAAALAHHEAMRERLAVADAERTRLQAEVEARSAVLASAAGADGPSLGAGLVVPSGLEAALAAALGETLEADAARWRELPPLADPPPMPDDAPSLAALIAAPSVLARALAVVGVIADPEQAAASQRHLAPGQALVSREGGLWRWDGYVVPPGTPNAAGTRLVERNRLASLKKRLAVATEATTRARAERDASARAEKESATAAAAAVTVLRTIERERDERRRAGMAARREAEMAAGRIAALETRTAALAQELTDVDEALEKLAQRRASLPRPEVMREALTIARTALATARARETAARSERAALEEKAAAAARRRDAIVRERAEWARRVHDLMEQREQMTARRRATTEERERLAVRPEALAAERAVAEHALAEAEALAREASEARRVGEDRRTAAEQASRTAERDAADARAVVIAADGALGQARTVLEGVRARIREQLGEDAMLPDASPETEVAARARLVRLERERDGMGPVNLRAEIEAAEIESRVAGIDREEEELRAAIAKLRGSIARLNHAGRERLTEVFTAVDRHFQALFATMFGGGRAHLAMVGSDDPLVAGLEIYAQPPGKKLAQLGLLSGGEQALVALSLIFAVFRCNPAPLVMLDEVDAPFDDANVERFSRLVTDIARASSARVLVVTHHPLTMARMDRLYGVTMQERGISRLLSVDLATGTDLADPSRRAAA